MTKKWYQSKTVILALLQGLIGIIIALQASNPSLIDVGYIAISKSIIDLLIRFLTTETIE